MSVANEYRAQFAWRSWSRILDRLPSVDGRVVLDLGCGVGDVAAEFVRRGARVTGLDSCEEFLREARSKQLPGAEFRMHDLRDLLDYSDVDGIWCSLVMAFFPQPQPILSSWAKSLRPGGWIALTEVDDFLGHGPVSGHTRELLNAFVEHACSAALCDFNMGRKLGDHLTDAGYLVSESLTLEDPELSFQGPAAPEVIRAWRARFERMPLLRRFCGDDFSRVRAEFLDCLASDDHRSTATVQCCIATRRK